MPGKTSDLIHIPIVVLGAGGVGQQLLLHIIASRRLHAEQGLRLSIKGVADSAALLVPSDEEDELADEQLELVVGHKREGKPLTEIPLSGKYFPREHLQPSRTDFSSVFGAHPAVLVDCSASQEVEKTLCICIRLGYCVVLANKRPLTESLESFATLALHTRRLRYESTVGAGLPLLSSLSRMHNSGDQVERISGALSGTLGYVMSALQHGNPLSTVVRTARELGYTEPDPRDDLSGMDVARKALILARTLGWSLGMEDVEVESLFPADMAPSAMPLPLFLESGLDKLDGPLGLRAEAAAARGQTLRYVATLADKKCRVGLQEVPLSSPLGQLEGSDNLVEIFSRCYPSPNPLVIQGAGAGNDTTAAGVLADIVDLQDLFVATRGRIGFPYMFSLH